MNQNIFQTIVFTLFISANGFAQSLDYRELEVNTILTEDHQRVPRTKFYFKTSKSYKYSDQSVSNDSIGFQIQEVDRFKVYPYINPYKTKEDLELFNENVEKGKGYQKWLIYHKIKVGDFKGLFQVYKLKKHNTYYVELILTDHKVAYRISTGKFQDLNRAKEIQDILMSFVFVKEEHIALDFVEFNYDFEALHLIPSLRSTKNYFEFHSDTSKGNENKYLICIKQTNSFEKGVLQNMDKLALKSFERQPDNGVIVSQGFIDVNGSSGYFIESSQKSGNSEFYKYSLTFTDSKYIFMVEGHSRKLDHESKRKLVDALQSLSGKG